MICDTNTKILEAAKLLFSTKGFKASSIRNIARAANISPAMIHYHFKTKEQLLDAITVTVISSFTELEKSLQNESGTTMQKMHFIIEYYVQRFVEVGPAAYILLQEELICSSKYATKITREFGLKQWSIFLKIVRTGQKKGEFAQDINTRLLFTSIVGTVRYTLFHNKNILNFNAAHKKQMHIVNMQKALTTHLFLLANKMLLDSDLCLKEG